MYVGTVAYKVIPVHTRAFPTSVLLVVRYQHDASLGPFGSEATAVGYDPFTDECKTGAGQKQNAQRRGMAVNPNKGDPITHGQGGPGRERGELERTGYTA